MSATRQALTAGMMERLGIRPPAPTPIEAIDSELAPSPLAHDYELLIRPCFAAWGLTPELVRIRVQPVGVNPAGLDVYAAFIKVQRWSPLVVQALTRMPQIEKKIDKRIRLSDLLRYSAFAGLWFRTPAKVEGALATVH